MSDTEDLERAWRHIAVLIISLNDAQMNTEVDLLIEAEKILRAHIQELEKSKK